ncbi:hypothetical protein D6855_13475 [Butyrivibrio sp. CB08]|uniref:YwaF family protein n=1 Tax=Butyrivibrio sp. CB08 TaxID=2364879 RepID=UPI000EAA93B7|nr:YwaF family protein [Butyrivibrio sp. CB08]RKM57553.1 hypothetical protein D6855_13475 [Butyrivibrio sp. CB08]
MKYFWLEKTLLPGQMGYDLFSAKHLISLLVLLVINIILYSAFCRMDDKKQDIFLKVCALTLPVVEIFKIIVLIIEGVFDAQYFPLYLCSIGIYLFPIAAFSRSKKIAEYAAEAGILMIIPGAMMALFFPNWIGFYPPFNFLSIYSYLWHGLIILIPVCMWRCGRVTISYMSIIHAFVALAVLLPIVVFADHVFHQNYWFLERPDLNNPFLFIYEKYDYTMYITCIVLLAFVMCTLSFMIFDFLQKKKIREK